MRIDKFLKVSRLVKRREVAKVLVEEGSILINSKKSKPSTEVKVDDVLEIHLGQRTIIAKIIKILNSANITQSKDMVEIISDSIKRP